MWVTRVHQPWPSSVLSYVKSSSSDVTGDVEVVARPGAVDLEVGAVGPHAGEAAAEDLRGLPVLPTAP
jgi:hypothetical protein